MYCTRLIARSSVSTKTILGCAEPDAEGAADPPVQAARAARETSTAPTTQRRLRDNGIMPEMYGPSTRARSDRRSTNVRAASKVACATPLCKSARVGAHICRDSRSVAGGSAIRRTVVTTPSRPAQVNSASARPKTVHLILHLWIPSSGGCSSGSLGGRGGRPDFPGLGRDLESIVSSGHLRPGQRGPAALARPDRRRFLPA